MGGRRRRGGRGSEEGVKRQRKRESEGGEMVSRVEAEVGR
jgi:hypothetical protein